LYNNGIKLRRRDMKLNKQKIESWINEYNPECKICGNNIWDIGESGVAVLDPNNSEMQLPLVNLTCNKCRNMILLNNSELFH
jgi:hypothetical protein